MRNDVSRARIHPVELPHTVGDLGDRSLESHERHVEAMLASIKSGMDMKDREERDLARQRAAGIYTQACADCGEDISPARLKALPGARRCVDCQRSYES